MAMMILTMNIRTGYLHPAAASLCELLIDESAILKGREKVGSAGLGIGVMNAGSKVANRYDVQVVDHYPEYCA